MVNKMKNSPKLEWITSKTPQTFPQALSFMEQRVDDIIQGHAPETIWLLEHPPLYTAGTSAKQQDLLTPNRFPVFATGRGGEYTYHGPGQRIVYVMLDLNKRKKDVRWFVSELETWVIDACASLGVSAYRREGRIGLWVNEGEHGLKLESKIAAIGIRLRRWVSFHGIAINIAPNLEHFSGIVPCGINNYGVTSFEDLNIPIKLAEIDAALKQQFTKRFLPQKTTKIEQA